MCKLSLSSTRRWCNFGWVWRGKNREGEKVLRTRKFPFKFSLKILMQKFLNLLRITSSFTRNIAFMRNRRNFPFIKVCFLSHSMESQSMMNYGAIYSFQYCSEKKNTQRRAKMRWEQSWSTFSLMLTHFMSLIHEYRGGEGERWWWENEEKVKGDELFIVMNIYDLIRFTFFFLKRWKHFFEKHEFPLRIRKGCEDLWRGKNVFTVRGNSCGFDAILHQPLMDGSSKSACGIESNWFLIFSPTIQHNSQ